MLPWGSCEHSSALPNIQALPISGNPERTKSSANRVTPRAGKRLRIATDWCDRDFGALQLYRHREVRNVSNQARDTEIDESPQSCPRPLRPRIARTVVERAVAPKCPWWRARSRFRTLRAPSGRAPSGRTLTRAAAVANTRTAAPPPKGTTRPGEPRRPTARSGNACGSPGGA
jgi:hypothetical protein